MEEKQVEVRQVSEREFLVGENRYCLSEDNVLTVIPIGEFDEKRAVAEMEFVLKIMNTVEGKVNLLVDLNKAGKTATGARKKMQEMFDNEKTGKVALFGLHPVARVLASFVIGISRKKDMRFFKTKEDALIWLKE